MAEVVEALAALGGLLLLFLTLSGLAVKYALLPWLRTQLVEPAQATAQRMEEVHQQVTVNSHSSPEPTIRDNLDDLAKAWQAMATAFDGHLEWSQEQVDLLWAEIERIRRWRNDGQG